MNTPPLRSPKPRNYTMDALKLFAIFLVIWGHCVQYLVSSDYKDEPLYRIIYSFHMPLFMTISGFFGANLYKKSFREAVLSKSRQLLVPIVTFGLIVSCFCGIRFSNFGILWFLNSLLACSLGYCSIMKAKRFRTVLLSVSLLLSVVLPLPYQLGRMWPFFLLGVLLNRNYDRFKDNAGKIALAVLPAFIVMLVFWDEKFWSTGNVLTAVVTGVSCLPPLMLEGYRYIIGFFGVVFFIAVFHFFATKLPHTRMGDMLLSWGKFTLGVYVIQKVVLEMGLKRVLNFDGIGFVEFNFVVVPLLSVGILLLCIAAIKIIRRSRYVSFALFGERLAG